MQRRITEILLVCSRYDKFMLDEDGRIEELLFQEYVSLNLRYPPRFVWAPDSATAADLLDTRSFDLVIVLPRANDPGCFGMAETVKAGGHDTPVVLLTPFSRELESGRESEVAEEFDYVFAWLGNADLLLAIVKLLEDELNLEHDVESVGVYTIILVEDSIRYYSSYLPILYRLLFEQARSVMKEGLNEHKRTMRMRGRPKILLASDYEEAERLYLRYQDYVLGIISDASYPRNGTMEEEAGLILAGAVRKTNPHLPFLLQSSNQKWHDRALELDAAFINKGSKSLLPELAGFVRTNFGFGDFAFKDPASGDIVARASTLREFQHRMEEVPESSVMYHAANYDFSRWLKARSYHGLGNILRRKTVGDYADGEAIRHYIVELVKRYRRHEGRGTIAQFRRERYDEYSHLTRIGNGSLGGKGRGLAFIDSILKENRLLYKYPGVLVTIPVTVVLGIDIYEEFMATNGIAKRILPRTSDQEILSLFLAGEMPGRIFEDLSMFLERCTKPLAVRSSSLLEDSLSRPFAGVYSTYMLPNNHHDPVVRLADLVNAIKCVYASTLFKGSRDYLAATQHLIDEEKMGVIIQEITGDAVGDLFFPAMSGVARSLNFYPVEGERPEEGIVNLALGLGRTVVGGGRSLRFSPARPKKLLQLSTPDSALGSTQQEFYGLDLTRPDFNPTLDEAHTLRKVPIAAAESAPWYRHLISTWLRRENRIRDGLRDGGKALVSFAGILKYDSFPLAPILTDLLNAGTEAMGGPIELEFAVDLNPDDQGRTTFSFLQIRPVVPAFSAGEASLDDIDPSTCLLTSSRALGEGSVSGIRDLVFVRPGSFDRARTREMVAALQRINDMMTTDNRYFALVVPGRLGSADPNLGIPVAWAQISRARLIAEVALEGFRTDPSQGTHFFQNITSLGVFYFTVDPERRGDVFDVTTLMAQSTPTDDPFFMHYRSETDLGVLADGMKGVGVVVAPITAPNATPNEAM